MSLVLEQSLSRFFGTGKLPALELDAIFFDNFNMAEDPRPQLFNMGTMDRELKQSAGVDSFGLFSITGEGEIAPQDTINQSYKQNYIPSKYSKRFGISKEMMDDDRYDLVSKAVASLGRSAKETQNVTAMNLFNNASGTTQSWDGTSLLSASHPSQIGNQSNSLGATDLTYGALATAEQTFRQFKDGKGKRLLLKPRVLLVAEANRQNALEIVQSPYKAGTANNNINALGADGGLTVISSPYLSSTTDWFLLSAPADHGLHIVDRQSVETRTHMDGIASVMYYICDYRQALGCDDWRGILGSISAP